MIKPTHDYICYMYIIFSFWMHFDDYFQPIEALIMDRLPRFAYLLAVECHLKQWFY